MWAVIDGRMVTNYLSCQPLLGGIAKGVVTDLECNMAQGVDITKAGFFFNCRAGSQLCKGNGGCHLAAW